MNTMGSGMSVHEWRGPEEVPNQQQIIKQLHQELMVKELENVKLREDICKAQAEGYEVYEHQIKEMVKLNLRIRELEDCLKKVTKLGLEILNERLK